MSYNLTNQAIEDSFQPLLQVDSGSALRDGTGSLVDNINVTASNATSSSYAVTASYALNVTDPTWNNITGKPSGLVSGSSQIDFNGVSNVPSGLVSSSTQIDLAQTFGTASHAISASYAVSASVEIIKEISSSYADHTQWSGIYNIPSGLVSGSSQVVLEDTTFTDNGEFSFLQTDGAGNLSFQYVESINDVVYAGENISKTDPLYVSGSQGANPRVFKADAADPNKAAIYIAAENITAGSTGRGILLGGIDAVDLTGIPAGTTVYLGEGGGWSITRPSGSNSLVQPLGIVTKTGSGGKGEILNPGPATLPNLQSGYAWVGDGGNQPQAVATSSFAVSIDTGSLVTTSSFNAYTSSTDARLSSIELETASLDTRVTSLENFSSSLDANFVSETEFGIYTSSNDSKVNNLISKTGSYATTGSNNFIGNQDVTGTVSSTQNQSNIHYNPQLITDNVTVPTGQNGIIIGETTISGDLTVEGNSEVFFYTQPPLTQYLTTASYLVDSASFDSRVDSLTNVTGSYATTGSNTFTDIQTIPFKSLSKNGISFPTVDFAQNPVDLFWGLNSNGELILSGSNPAQGWTNSEIIRFSPQFQYLYLNPSLLIFQAMQGSSIFVSRIYSPGNEDIEVRNGLNLIPDPGQPRNNITVSGSVYVSESVDVGTVLNLTPQNPLPTGSVGDLATSGSNLYFHNGTNWSQIN